MRLAFAVPLVLLIVAGCSDDKPVSSPMMTAPKAARLSLKSLPKDASSVCRANVASRDELLAKGDSGIEAQLNALDNVINDVCF
jgi:hypothetical protein